MRRFGGMKAPGFDSRANSAFDARFRRRDDHFLPSSPESKPRPMLELPLKSAEMTAMRIGVPKEIKTHEYRVGLTPGAVREYVAAGHKVLGETNAGEGIGASDETYRKAGADIADTSHEVFSAAEMIV